MFIVDAHLDLAYNATTFGRDLRLPLADIRAAEEHHQDVKKRGTALVSMPELRRGGIGLAFGTLFALPAGKQSFPGEEHLSYRTADEAFRIAQSQLDYYHRLADEVDYVRVVGDLPSLDEVVNSHADGGEGLLGIVPLMEGADPIREPAEAELWYERGLRLIGLAWDDTRYAAGAWQAGGPLTAEGYLLLDVMADLGFILDLTHMSDEASLQALDRYEGPVIASHSNARAIVPTARQLSDQQIRRIAEHDGVIGVVLANNFLKPELRKSDPKETVTLQDVVAHVDHMCQLIGDAAHVGLGSDFDGGFGLEHVPAEIESAASLPRIAEALKAYGYAPADTAQIMGGNWLALLRRTWSK
jgi:membrane dipeptidase